VSTIKEMVRSSGTGASVQSIQNAYNTLSSFRETLPSATLNACVIGVESGMIGVGDVQTSLNVEIIANSKSKVRCNKNNKHRKPDRCTCFQSGNRAVACVGPKES
jgi:hypothetical protein